MTRQCSYGVVLREEPHCRSRHWIRLVQYAKGGVPVFDQIIGIVEPKNDGRPLLIGDDGDDWSLNRFAAGDLEVRPAGHLWYISGATGINAASARGKVLFHRRSHAELVLARLRPQ